MYYQILFNEQKKAELKNSALKKYSQPDLNRRSRVLEAPVLPLNYGSDHLDNGKFLKISPVSTQAIEVN